MYTVLVPVDSEEARAKATVDVVTSIPIEATDVEIVLINIFKEFDVTDGEGGVVNSDEMFDEKDLPESVHTAVSLLKDAGYSPTVRREHGNVVETIMSTAEGIDADHIVMAGRKRSPVGKAIFGSTLQGVLSAADVPVTVTLE
ncbi:universal stress protein [Natronorubrum sp. FCH18a]|uniref:universal stress protein n=1 Tax=Natronorubrum sp. FCH18a TaxID=3447018 RepID=UPI003F50ECEA